MVKDPKVHQEVIRKVIDFADYLGFEILHLDYSPVKGPEGNIEYLVHIRKDLERSGQTEGVTESLAEEELSRIMEEKSGYSAINGISGQIIQTVKDAHESLDV